MIANGQPLDGAPHGIARGPRRRARELDLGPIEAIPLGQGRAYLVAGRTIAVFRQRDGALFAIDERCPHRGGSLVEGLLGDGRLVCPLHGWQVDLASGRCLGEPAQVEVYAVRLVGGRVRISVPE